MYLNSLYWTVNFLNKQKQSRTWCNLNEWIWIYTDSLTFLIGCSSKNKWQKFKKVSKVFFHLYNPGKEGENCLLFLPNVPGPTFIPLSIQELWCMTFSANRHSNMSEKPPLFWSTNRTNLVPTRSQFIPLRAAAPETPLLSP